MTRPAALGNTPLLPDLDLAFASDDDLPADLLTAAGDLADPLAGADLWHGALSQWLAQLQGERRPRWRQAPTASVSPWWAMRRSRS